MKIYCDTPIDLHPSDDGTGMAGWDLPSGHTFVFDLQNREWSDPKSILGSFEFKFVGNKEGQNDKLLFVSPDEVEPDRKSNLYVVQNLPHDWEIANVRQRALFDYFEYDKSTGTLIALTREFPELYPKAGVTARIWFKRSDGTIVFLSLNTNGTVTIKNITRYTIDQSSSFVMRSSYTGEPPIRLHPKTPFVIGDDNIILLRDDLPMHTICDFLNTDPAGNVMILRANSGHALETVSRYYRTQTVDAAANMKVIIIGYDYNTTAMIRKHLTRQQDVLRRISV